MAAFRQLMLAVVAATFVACTGSSGSTWLGNGGADGGPSGGSQGLAGSGAHAGAVAEGGSSGSTSAGAASGGAGSGNVTGSFDIVVNGASYTLAIGNSAPVSGDFFAVIDVTLSNTSVDSPLSTGPANFSLRTDDSLAVLPSAASALLEPRCREDLAVAEGGIASCRLAFEVSATQTPAELRYDDQGGHIDAAPVPEIVTGSTACERFSTWLSVDSPACDDCVASACPDEVLAMSLAFDCQDEFDCVSVCTEGCACMYACLATPACRQIEDAVWNCLADTCTPACE